MNWIPLADGGVQRADVILPLAGDVSVLSLEAQELSRRDRWGNTFRYRAIVTLLSGQRRWSYDVFLRSEPVNTIPASQVPRK